jgi:hypothetical protein
MGGVQGALFVPGSQKVALPRTKNGIGSSRWDRCSRVAGARVREPVKGESHTWRATREFALLGEILGSVDWGTSIC